MRTPSRSALWLVLFAFSTVIACSPASTDERQSESDAQSATEAQEADLWAELNELAIVEEMVMMPMRDGVRLATHIYRPKTTDGSPVPTDFGGRSKPSARATHT